MKEAHESNPHLCVECVHLEDNRLTYYRQHNFNWMDVAKEAELDVWERQPSETDREWQVWLKYRDAYPSVKPSYRLVAEDIGTTLNVVKKIGMRWTFPARLQAWAKYCDGLTMAQRQKEIVDMNKKHIDMATTLREKLKTAIDLINPATLEPKDIQGLFKLSTDIERKARLDDVYVKPVELDDSNSILKKAPTKTEDISEILQILGKAGMLGAGMQVGVRKTTTTTSEVIVKGDNDETM